MSSNKLRFLQIGGIMEAMDFDPDTLLASGSSDPMLGKPVDQMPLVPPDQLPQSQPPSGLSPLSPALVRL